MKNLNFEKTKNIGALSLEMAPLVFFSLLPFTYHVSAWGSPRGGATCHFLSLHFFAKCQCGASLRWRHMSTIFTLCHVSFPGHHEMPRVRCVVHVQKKQNLSPLRWRHLKMCLLQEDTCQSLPSFRKSRTDTCLSLLFSEK